jgi:hypothetical protein
MFHHGEQFFIFIPKKKFALSFVLSFGRRVHFRGQKVNFWQKKFPPKNRNSKNSKKKSPFLGRLYDGIHFRVYC